jgi:two-component system, sensor histidine kinase and response regulator
MPAGTRGAAWDYRVEDTQVSRMHRVLAADDDPLNLIILEELLQEEYDLITVSSGEEALAQAERLKPDLLLLDIMMPGIDGYETCRRMRANKVLRFSKIILVSAKAMLSERLKGYEAGADDYITKPFDHSELLAKIKVFLRLKSAEEMDDLKTEFLVLLAHETRTPLTQLYLLAGMLGENGTLQEEDLRRVSGMIQETSERLADLFEHGLEYFSLRAGRVLFERTRFDLRSVLQDAVADQERMCGILGAAIDLSGPPTAVIDSDLDRVRLTLQLLIGSALDRGGVGCHIPVELSVGDSGVCVTLSCPHLNGDPASIHLLLEPFRSPDVSHHSGGGVIALPLAAELMRHLQGELRIDLKEQRNLRMRAVVPRAANASAEGWVRESGIAAVAPNCQATNAA